MKQTRRFFTQDFLVADVKKSLLKGLKRYHYADKERQDFSNVDCLLAALALFTFKYPSLLQFDQHRLNVQTLKGNLLSLFGLEKVPCDTQMRTRLDDLHYNVTRQAFTHLFTHLQRGKVLEHFRFLDKYYLISLDGTGMFSSPSVHCENCCVKEHRNGKKTYYHQMLCGALVHPDQSVVFPFAPQPIMKSDGQRKNDCERNAAKRWIQDFRREHPHLQGLIVADGLSSNGPFIQWLTAHHLSYLLVCKDADHRYLVDFLLATDPQDAPRFSETIGGITKHYHYMNDVSLNKSHEEIKVSVVRYQETKGGKTRTWMWVTNLFVTEKNIREIVRGGRARWKIENETFNTLKNQGYEFEHNFGHGHKYLSSILAYLMILAFFMDQCLMKLNKRFQDALRTVGSKRCLWQTLRSYIEIWVLPNFETLYELIARPPPGVLPPPLA